MPVIDEIKGRVPDVYVSLNPGATDTADISARVIQAGDDMIGKIARPRMVHIVPDMPKTRSDKIMRRVLAAISNGHDAGEVTTLANSSVVEEIRVLVQGEDAVAATDALPADIAQFGKND